MAAAMVSRDSHAACPSARSSLAVGISPRKLPLHRRAHRGAIDSAGPRQHLFIVVLDIRIARQAPVARGPLEPDGFFAIHTKAQGDQIVTTTRFRSKEGRA